MRSTKQPRGAHELAVAECIQAQARLFAFARAGRGAVLAQARRAVGHRRWAADAVRVVDLAPPRQAGGGAIGCDSCCPNLEMRPAASITSARSHESATKVSASSSAQAASTCRSAGCWSPGTPAAPADGPSFATDPTHAPGPLHSATAPRPRSARRSAPDPTSSATSCARGSRAGHSVLGPMHHARDQVGQHDRTGNRAQAGCDDDNAHEDRGSLVAP
jgi:hypothetical protein